MQCLHLERSGSSDLNTNRGPFILARHRVQLRMNDVDIRNSLEIATSGLCFKSGAEHHRQRRTCGLSLKNISRRYSIKCGRVWGRPRCLEDKHFSGYQPDIFYFYQICVVDSEPFIGNKSVNIKSCLYQIDKPICLKYYKLSICYMTVNDLRHMLQFFFQTIESTRVRFKSSVYWLSLINVEHSLKSSIHNTLPTIEKSYIILVNHFRTDFKRMVTPPPPLYLVCLTLSLLFPIL